MSEDKKPRKGKHKNVSCSGRLTKQRCPGCKGFFYGDDWGPKYNTCECQEPTIEQRAEEWFFRNILDDGSKLWQDFKAKVLGGEK